MVSQRIPDSVFQKDYIRDLEEYKVHLESYLEEVKENSVKPVEAPTKTSMG